MSDPALLLESFVRQEPGGNAWCEHALASAAPLSVTGFRAAYAGASRRLASNGQKHVAPTPALTEWARPHWTLVDWARAALLARALRELPSDAQPAFVLNLLEGGELGEQESLLRTLTLLPEAGRFVEAGLSACRSNALRVFEAIACENAFPARSFAELGFNQMVLKAIFLGVALQRMEGLPLRNGPELQRMALAYASERRAAGRPVPSDVDLILSGLPSVSGESP